MASGMLAVGEQLQVGDVVVVLVAVSVVDHFVG
jgi:hypothetical protein